MIKKLFLITTIGMLILSCSYLNNKQANQPPQVEKEYKVYSENWNLTFNDEKNKADLYFSANLYDGLWRDYKTYNVDYGLSNYQLFSLFYKMRGNYWFCASIFNGYNKFKKKYEWTLIFTVNEERNNVEGFESFGTGLVYVKNGLPNNYLTSGGTITIIDSNNSLKSYWDEMIDGIVGCYVVALESEKIFENAESISVAKIFSKQNFDETLDQYISVDPMEGMWYLATDDSPASEEAFMNTKAVLVIGKDEELNPGWYHVVLYYDSGNEDTGWICEWGAAEIAEKELYVQLSSMSEGKPFTIELNEKDGMRWLSLKHQAQQIKEGQFVRILPLK